MSEVYLVIHLECLCFYRASKTRGIGCRVTDKTSISHILMMFALMFIPPKNVIIGGDRKKCHSSLFANVLLFLQAVWREKKKSLKLFQGWNVQHWGWGGMEAFFHHHLHLLTESCLLIGLFFFLKMLNRHIRIRLFYLTDNRLYSLSQFHFLPKPLFVLNLGLSKFQVTYCFLLCLNSLAFCLSCIRTGSIMNRKILLFVTNTIFQPCAL